MKKLFSIITIILVLGGALSAQSCCGWVPLTWDTAPASIKAFHNNPTSYGRGAVSVSSDHFGPGSSSLQFDFDTLPGTGYGAIFMKVYPHITLTDSFLPGIATKCIDLDLHLQIWFYSNGAWKQLRGIDENPFWEYQWSIYRCGGIDIDTVIVGIFNQDNNAPGWFRLDNFQYVYQNDTIVLDSMGESGTAVEEVENLGIISHENNSIFMRVGERVNFPKTQIVYDLNGRIIYSGKEFSPVSTGQYYSIGQKNERTKIIVIN